MNRVSSSFLAGAKAALPVVFGYIPVAIAYAILAREAGLNIVQTMGLSLFVYAGAAQIMAVGMIEQGVALITIIITTFLLNLRHIIMSICVMNGLEDSSLASRLAGAFWITDETFAVFTTSEKKDCSVPFFFGLILTSYFSWQIGTLIGCLSIQMMPESLSIAFGIALYAMFIALMVPGTRGNFRLLLLIAATALLNLLLTQWLGSGWALIVSTLTGAAAGVFLVELPGENT